MSNLELTIQQFKKNNNVYFLNEYEEIVMRLEPTKTSYNCYAKQKSKNEYSIKRTTNLVLETELGGEIITKKYYDEY